MGQGFALSGAAGAMSDTLQDILKQKFLEQIARARLTEDARQADMTNALGHRNAATNEGHLGVRRDEFGLNKDEFGQTVRAYNEAAPARAASVRLHTAQAGDLERKPQAEADDFARDMQIEGLRGGNRLQQIKAEGDQNARTASIRTANSGQMTPTQQLTQTRMLRNEYQRATTTAREMTNQLGFMEQGLAAAKKGDLNSGSQAVLVTFQKILDPTSVVRESEYARSQAGLGILQQMQGILPRLQQGGPGVPVAELEKFAALARQMTAGVKAHADEQARGVREIATAYGLNPDLVAPSDKPEATGGGVVPPTGPKLSAKDMLNKYRGSR
jgi:hypothetical protein